ncbi:hypothetical protein CEXT_78291 [Caerostris extrusa]|uniref:Uncharacterized protein n=1 Tax=Caerostris extrusa TaxID=172846 RepID=A0AAV4RT72_CAEEX|nr:hypothetical protein CEXT_78291 [Caerostris extrusa]
MEPQGKVLMGQNLWEGRSQNIMGSFAGFFLVEEFEKQLARRRTGRICILGYLLTMLALFTVEIVGKMSYLLKAELSDMRCLRFGHITALSSNQNGRFD